MSALSSVTTSVTSRSWLGRRPIAPERVVAQPASASPGRRASTANRRTLRGTYGSRGKHDAMRDAACGRESARPATTSAMSCTRCRRHGRQSPAGRPESENLRDILRTLSESGRKVLRERPGWIRKVNGDVERMGARVVAQWAVLGPYDFVTVVDAA